MPLTQQQLGAIQRSVERYSGDVAKRAVEDVLKSIKTAVESLIKPGTEIREGVAVEVGLNPATARSAVAKVVKDHGLAGLMDSDRIDFALTTARDVANGAGVYAKEVADADVVDAYPGWELLRIYDRDVPRGFRRFKGALIPVPGDDWESRWQAAGGVLMEGRMVALKADPIWQRLGDGVGGYTDTLGNPFPPFAFNSGFDVNNLSHTECVGLGLLQPDQAVPLPEVDLDKLFAPLEAAA